jgi:hypothetical protein
LIKVIPGSGFLMGERPASMFEARSQVGSRTGVQLPKEKQEQVKAAAWPSGPDTTSHQQSPSCLPISLSHESLLFYDFVMKKIRVISKKSNNREMCVPY